MAESSWIKIRAASEHNLRSLSCQLPVGKMTVITGVSGCGKSSLAFHTLYAQAQRYFVESLSAQARQFLEQLPEPEVEAIEGLRPAIALEQQRGRQNPRATVASITEIEHFLRVLWATCGDGYDPNTGEKLEIWTAASILNFLLQHHEEARALILAPIKLKNGIGAEAMLRELSSAGFVRLRVDGQTFEIEDADCEPALEKAKEAQVVVDRLVLRDRGRERLADSLEIAIGRGIVEVRVAVQQKADDSWQELSFPTVPTNPLTGFRAEKLSPAHFSARSRRGACGTCQGLGYLLQADAEMIVADKQRSIAQGALKTWWTSKKRLRATRLSKLREIIESFVAQLAAIGAEQKGAMLNSEQLWDSPWVELPLWLQQLILEGEPWLESHQAHEVLSPNERETLAKVLTNARWEGLLLEAERVYQEAKSQLTRQLAKRSLSPKECPACQGKRLNPSSLAVGLRGKIEHPFTQKTGQNHVARQFGFADFLSLSIEQAVQVLESWQPEVRDQAYAKALLKELKARLGFLAQVGLDYLQLDRAAHTLSGGEEQRLRLATQLGGPLTGVLYVLDEPTIGLHPADTQRLLNSLQALVKRGNTVVVVEHDSAFWQAADWLIELGPGPGAQGGELIYQGKPEQLRDAELSLSSPTRKALEAQEQGGYPLDKIRQSEEELISKPELKIIRPRAYNLRCESVSFPLGCLVALTGPSGSGKSSFIGEILYPALARSYHRSTQKPLEHKSIEGMEYLDRVVMVDQSSLSGSKRSNALTYCKAFEPIRKLFAQLPLSRQRGYQATRFSFNRPGGRCEVCEGMGSQVVDMQLLAPVEVPCDACQGQRYNPPTLEVRFKGKHMAEILDMDVDQAMAFFAQIPEITRRLEPLQKVGLGYLKLGQSSESISGGEAQRLRLAAELALPKQARTLYLLDEPSTGLHPEDIQVLLKALRALIEKGHSVLVIEHQVDVIRAADWVIDLGPGGGKSGGEVIFSGTPEKLKKSKSILSSYL